jgi:hypothetical protein
MRYYGGIRLAELRKAYVILSYNSLISGAGFNPLLPGYKVKNTEYLGK